MNKKGYIGAIGDDLPSLIPIFIGITIFFAVFLNTYNVYKNNTDLYSLRNDAITISGIMKEESLISDQNQFIKSCARINTKYKWNSFLTSMDLNTHEYRALVAGEIEDQNILKHWKEEDKRFICKSTTEDFAELNTALLTKDVTVFKYPITVQQEFLVEPAWLYVFVWKG